jgi:hypothetical protein
MKATRLSVVQTEVGVLLVVWSYDKLVHSFQFKVQELSDKAIKVQAHCVAKVFSTKLKSFYCSSYEATLFVFSVNVAIRASRAEIDHPHSQLG